METTLRNATLSDIATTLKEQADARFDVVAHSSSLGYLNGNLTIQGGAEPIITDTGVTSGEVTLRPTDIFEDGIASRLDIPGRYLRKMRSGDEISLLDANVNTWLANSNKQWFVRGFKTDNDEIGIARAFLSDRFNCYDNFDVLMAALTGIKNAGINVNVVGCDLTERRMSVRIEAPEVAALAPDLLGNYKSPFTGATGADNPTVFAGFILSNSETGGGAFTITPRLVVQICNNGMTITKDALRKVHLGSKMDEGVIQWSNETNRRNVELITSQATDAVTTFCNVEYVRSKINEISEAAGQAVEPTKVIEKISKSLSFTEEESEGILGHFITGGDLTAGGVMHAVTSYSQTVFDPDRANMIEEAGLQALALAAS